MAGGRSRKAPRKKGRKRKSTFSLKKLWARRGTKIAAAVGVVFLIFAAGYFVGNISRYATNSPRPEKGERLVKTAPPVSRKDSAIPFAQKASVSEAPEKEKPTAAPEDPPPAPARVVAAKPSAPREADQRMASLPPSTYVKPLPHGQVAIIIDDIGQNMGAVRRLLAIGQPIALSILPYQAHSLEAAAMAREKGQVVMLHLPMEPKSHGNNPGEGALLATHDDASLRRIFADDIQWTPGAVGVNNHMGSLLTENEESMAPLMEEMRKRGLFFVDSKTSSGSVAFSTAMRMGVPSASRDVFLDNERDVRKIIRALEELTEKAIRHGTAVGIGHPYPETLRALEIYTPQMAAKGVRLTPVTNLLRNGADFGIRAHTPEAACAGQSC